MPEICHCINATSIFVERDCVRIARTPEVTLTRWRSLREEEIPIVAVIVGFVHQIMFSFTLNVMIVSPKWSTFFSLYSPLQILPRTSSTPCRFLTQIIRRANILSIVQFSYHQTHQIVCTPPIAFRRFSFWSETLGADNWHQVRRRVVICHLWADGRWWPQNILYRPIQCCTPHPMKVQHPWVNRTTTSILHCR